MRWEKWRKRAPFIALLVLLILIPILVKNLYHLGTITFILINVLLGVSLWFIITTGQVSLGHAGFAAIGGYMSAALITSYGFSSWLSLPVAIAAGGIVAAIIGYVTLRIKGIYFMITTLALGEIIRIVFGMFKHPFGGLVGIMNLPPPDPIAIPGLPAIEFVSKPALYYLTLAFVLLGVAIMYRLSRSRIGLTFYGISQADNLAEHVGINIMGYKVLAFVIGSMCASLAGVLYTFYTRAMLPSSFTLTHSIYYLVYVAVGGGANIAGPILGVSVLSVVSELLRPVREFEPIIYGLLLIGAVLFFKEGLLGMVQTLRHKFTRWIERVNFTAV